MTASFVPPRAFGRAAVLGYLLAVALGVVGQIALLRWAVPFPYGLAGGGGAWLAVAAPVLLALGFWRANSPAWLHLAIATGSLGGLSMVAGQYFDGELGRAGLEFCAPPADLRALAGSLITWANALMLFLCLALCAVFSPCPAGGGGWLERWRAYLFCLAGMWLGMMAGGRLLLVPLGYVGDMVVSSHVAMVCGMMAGAALAHAKIRPEETGHGLAN